MSIYTDILQKYWGYTSFRPLQEEIIRSVADEGKDTLGLLPTGGGKSIIFQVPALSKEGVCVVITPLIALMKDQVENLRRRNIPAVAVYSGLTFLEIQAAFDSCTFGGAKFLYLSPERLGTELFLERLKTLKVSLLAVDEAHCISQWGYDFRPSYLKIAEIRQHLPGVPVLALTATATPQVADDIQEKLLFKEKNLFKKSFARSNLVYIVRKVDDKENYLMRIVNNQPGTGVVYVRNRRKTRETAEFLLKHGISADYFHAGLTQAYKDFRQQQWKDGKTRIICSTNAFGMGIDKPDVRFVVHLDVPDSLEAYFQEAGRGGRDEKTAYAVMLYNDYDIASLRRNLTNSFPPREYIKRVYTALGNYYQIPIGSAKGRTFEFKIGHFVEQYSFNIMQCLSALKILQRNGYIETTEEITVSSRIMFVISREDLYKYQVANRQIDAFIKLLLRSYTGLFSNYANISEEELAKYFQCSCDTVIEMLKKMSSQKIISYIPQKRTPFIIFTEERLDEKSIIISPQSYDLLREHYTQRVNAVIKYCLNDQTCRSRQLTEYFGETQGQDCGQCDVCRSKKTKILSSEEFDELFDTIFSTLKIAPTTIEGIIQSTSHDQHNISYVLQKMLDDQVVSQNASGEYFITEGTAQE
ncbi:MAG: RecQ family ATP-dependent DNA helicase [Bacteroidales bacterium]|nr:RecQ family ATP-dependent DNA helicase [Bacteroidales bacterium]